MWVDDWIHPVVSAVAEGEGVLAGEEGKLLVQEVAPGPVSIRQEEPAGQGGQEAAGEGFTRHKDGGCAGHCWKKHRWRDGGRDGWREACVDPLVKQRAEPGHQGTGRADVLGARVKPGRCRQRRRQQRSGHRDTRGCGLAALPAELNCEGRREPTRSGPAVTEGRPRNRCPAAYL